MPTKGKKKKFTGKDKSKMTKIYKICNSNKKKYKLSDQKTERCVLALKKKFHVQAYDGA